MSIKSALKNANLSESDLASHFGVSTEEVEQWIANESLCPNLAGVISWLKEQKKLKRKAPSGRWLMPSVFARYGKNTHHPHKYLRTPLKRPHESNTEACQPSDGFCFLCLSWWVRAPPKTLKPKNFARVGYTYLSVYTPIVYICIYVSLISIISIRYSFIVSI